jgi:hypothetical protein
MEGGHVKLPDGCLKGQTASGNQFVTFHSGKLYISQSCFEFWQSAKQSPSLIQITLGFFIWKFQDAKSRSKGFFTFYAPFKAVL